MLKSCLKSIDQLSEWSGRLVSPLIYLLLGVLIFEVVSRHFFGKPTIWAHETGAFLFGAYFMLGAAYSHLHDGMINVDIICGRLSRRTQALLNVITFVFFLSTCLTLIFMGGDDAIHSWQVWEHSNSTWQPPLYPIRTIIPVSALLLFLQGLSKLSRELTIVVTGRAKEESQNVGN